MAMDLFNPFNQDINVVGSSLQNNQVSQAARDSIQNQSNIQNNTGSVTNHFQSIVNTFLPSLSAVKGALTNTSKLFRQIMPAARHNSSEDAAKSDADYLAAVNQIAHEISEMSELAETDFSYRTHATERIIQLQNDRLLWEKAVIEQNLTLIRNFQTATLEQKYSELQVQVDMHYLPLQVRRDDVLELLYQESGKFVIIPSSPKITSDLPVFQSLNREISHELKDAIKKYYASGEIPSPIGYKDIFTGSIGDAHASKIGKLLSPIPTLIFQSEITYQKVFISVTITCPSVELQSLGSDCPLQQILQESFDLKPLNWMSLKKELESQGQDPETINQNILDLIASIHTVVAISFSDLYCLNLNPCHKPKLFDFLDASRFSDILKVWTEPLQNSLRDTQKRIQEELNRLNEPKIKQSGPTYSFSDTNFDFDDFESAPLIACGLVIMFLFAMCSQQSPQTIGGNTGTQSPIEQRQSSQATSARIEVPISTGYKEANLRSAPTNGNEFIIGQVKNGEQIIAYEVSPDGQWRRVKLSDGRSGWVASNFVK